MNWSTSPVQATWLGYPNTTGLRAVDYRITDSWADPPGTTEALHTEELVRLPHGFLCYKAPAESPPPVPPPVLASGVFTFGSFNNLAKVTEEALATWAAILKRVNGSRLVLKAKALREPDARRRVLEALARHGAGEDRVVLLPPIPRHDHHLAIYNIVDAALDTFPYNGTTTTCEAWPTA